MHRRPRKYIVVASVLPVLLALMLAAVLAVGVAPAHAATSECSGPVAGRHIYDCTGILTVSDIALLEAHAKTVDQAGAPVVVYLQVKDASYDETYDDAGNLMQRWNIESQPGAHDGLVIFLNLTPGNEHHGQVALFAGEKHFQHGNLPESELERIYQDVMLPRLADGDLTGGIAAGLDAAAHSLRYGPPVDRTQQAAANFGRVPYNLLALLLAAASVWLFARFRYKPADPLAATERQLTPPSDLAPALAGALVQGRVKEAQVEATLVDFARRGLVAFEPVGDKAQVRLIGDGNGLSAYERLLWQGLDTLAGPDKVIEVGQLPSLKGNWGAVRQALHADMIERGWYDPQAALRRRRLYIAALSCFVIAVVGVIVAVVAQEGWAIIGTALLAVSGILALIGGVRLPNLSQEGEVMAAPWQGYRNGLQWAGSNDLQQLDQDRAIPYAVALGASATATALAAFGDDPQKQLPLEVAQTQSTPQTYVSTYPYWLYWGAFHSTVYPPVSSSSGGGYGGSFGGAASGGGGAGGSF